MTAQEGEVQEPQSADDSVQVSIVIPAYNEEAAIGADLDAIRETMDASSYTYEVIVVDDGSRDRTVEEVRKRPWVRLLQHPQNRGTGAARNTGTEAARADIVGMTDGDGTYPVRDFPAMFDMLIQGNHAMVIGARRTEAGTVRLLRSSAKWFIRKLACYLTQTDIPDLNSGMRAFHKEPWRRFRNILPNTHSWVSTITIACLSNGLSVGFMPIDYFPRKGRSSFHPIRDTYNYLSLVVRSVMYFNPLRIFLPVTLVLFLVAFLKLIRDFIVYQSFYVPAITLMIFLTALQIGALGMLADLIVRKTR